MLGELLVPRSLIRGSVEDEVTESFLLRRAGGVDLVAARTLELEESIESKHQMGLLFEAIGKLDADLGGVFWTASGSRSILPRCCRFGSML